MSCFLFSEGWAELPHAPLHPPALSQATSGDFSLITYNIAGLPDWISKSHPARNTPVIAARLNRFDIALVQEDFSYHHALRDGTLHLYRSRKMEGLLFVDGLNRFSRLPMEGHHRVPFQGCHGLLSAAWDCWARKGFSRARHLLADGVAVDVYNLHMDAGRSPSDGQVRVRQLRQLGREIRRLSRDRPVIVAGDANLRRDQQSVIDRFLSDFGLRDACEEVSCRRPDIPDHVWFRGGAGIELSVSSYSNGGPDFRDHDAEPLSDHLPVAVGFAWTID